MKKNKEAKPYEQQAKKLRKIANWILMFSLAFIVFALVIDILPSKAAICDTVSSIILGIAPSVFAGAFVARIIDTPSLINSFKELVVSSLTSDSYLVGLPKDRLQGLKDNINQEMRKESDRIPNDFHLLDNKLSAYIREPFYDYFNDDVICSKPMSIHDAKARLLAGDIRIESQDDQHGESSVPEKSKENKSIGKRYVVKQIHTEYKLINPTSKSAAIADIGIRKSLDFPEATNVEDMFLLQECLVSIDGGDFAELNVNVESFTKKGTIGSNPNTMTYNSIIGLSLNPIKEKSQPRLLDFLIPFYKEEVSDLDELVLTKDNFSEFKYSGIDGRRCNYCSRDDDAFSKLLVSFDHSVTVKMKYKIIIPEADNHYTRRLRYPARTLLEQYTCDSDVHIHGQVLGTLVDQKDIAILQSDPRHITIQCRGWLLPGNGTFIVLDDIVK